MNERAPIFPVIPAKDESAFRLGTRLVGAGHAPLVIAEIGINHEGRLDRALQMVDDAAKVGCECIKIQTHIPECEMIPNQVVPANSSESIWDIIRRCTLSEEDEATVKRHVESRGMIFLSTPFSREAADRLDRLGVSAFKIGSGECNNLPLVRHIAKFGKPVLLSTGMNTLASVRSSVDILRSARVPFALFHCTSVYPTLPQQVRLGALAELKAEFPEAVMGLSDHSHTIYPCLGAIALGASLVERHFTSDKSWPGPDIPISMDPIELGQLIEGSRLIHLATGGQKGILPEEQPTIRFAYASVVATRDIEPGETLDEENIWVKRPGTGDIPASRYFELVGKQARSPLRRDEWVRWENVL